MNWSMLDCDGAVFDFDGTLVDSMPYWGGNMIRVLNNHRIDYPEDIIRTITPLGDIGSAEYFIHELGLNMTVEEVREEVNGYSFPCYRDIIPAKEGVKEVLEALKQAGVRLCVLTACPPHRLRPCLERNGLADYFEFTWCCDDLGMKKTETAIYDKTCEALGTRPDRTIFFDDNLLALQTARAAGLTTVGVYDASSEEDAPEIRSSVDHYIREWKELL